MWRANPGCSLVYLRLQNSGNAKVANLQSSFLVDEDIGRCPNRLEKVKTHKPVKHLTLNISMDHACIMNRS